MLINNVHNTHKTLFTLHSIQHEACYLSLNIPLGWSFAEAFSPLVLSEDAHTLLESLQVFFSSPPPGVRRYELNAKWIGCFRGCR